MFGDNNGSLALAANPGGEHPRSKHIDVRYHYIRQRVELKEVNKEIELKLEKDL